MTNIEKYTPKGYLEIIKIDRDGEEEVLFSDRNTIVSGMGVGLSYMFAGSGSRSIKDFQIGKFQVGTSSHATYGASTFQLASALTYTDYGGSPFSVCSLDQYANGVVQSNKAFLQIPFNLVRRIDRTTVQFGLVLDNSTANLSNPLKEIGLFMNNPLNYVTPTPILVAYKVFSPILKTNDITLLFKWTITF